MSAKLQSLIVSYCDGFPRDVEALVRTLSPALGGTDAILGNLAEALERVHRMKGAGGSLGFAAVSCAAAQLEARLREFDATASADDAEIGTVLESLMQLKELAASIKPEGSSLYGLDLSRVVPQARGLAGGGEHRT
jgi:HPt (histidine-containing phosphotransfer) domain-containing protein